MILAFTLILIWSQSSAQDVEGDPLNIGLAAEAQTILDAGQGQARKWLAPPDVVVVYRDPRMPAFVQSTLAEIEMGRENFFGFGEVKFFDLNDYTDDLYRKTDVSIIRIGEEGHERKLRLSLNLGDRDIRIHGNIFVFTVGLEEMLLLGALTQTDPQFMRTMAKDEEQNCHYSAWSTDDVIHTAATYVRSDYPETWILNCLYEEMFQSLGLLNDAVGSVNFTFDDTLRPVEDRTLDRLLLDALYHDTVQPGSPVGDTVDIFTQTLEQR
ncbi:DUF2927 domain-containing protein [Yoonia sp. GPGPB17]|uniref:DUF2927 domain-containing protein n=1 Tax=Yoonia sp. GPGPB17 TaxID=3026147 RepID=UPI0030BA85BC